MARIKEYPSIESFDGDADALAIEQTDGANNRTRKVTPAQLKQYIEAGDFEATGEIKDGHGNVLNDINTISNKHTITTTTSGVTINRGEYYTWGKIVFVSLDVTITGTAIIATLPKPVSQVDVLNCDYPNNSDGAFVELRTNGALELRKGSGASSSRLIANLMYLSNDV